MMKVILPTTIRVVKFLPTIRVEFLAIKLVEIFPHWVCSVNRRYLTLLSISDLLIENNQTCQVEKLCPCGVANISEENFRMLVKNYLSSK